MFPASVAIVRTAEPRTVPIFKTGSHRTHGRSLMTHYQRIRGTARQRRPAAITAYSSVVPRVVGFSAG